MSFQYTYDTNGKPLGVFVPINEWEKITTILKDQGLMRAKKKKNNTLSGILKGLTQVHAIEKGKMKSIPLKQLLNELYSRSHSELFRRPNDFQKNIHH